HGGRVDAVVSTWIFFPGPPGGLCGGAAARGFPVPWALPVAPAPAPGYLAGLGSGVAVTAPFLVAAPGSLMTVSTLSFVVPIIALIVDALFEADIRLDGRAYVGIGVTLSGLIVSLAWKRVASASPVALGSPHPAAPTGPRQSAAPADL